MTTAPNKLHDKIIDKYLASCPSLHPQTESISESNVPRRYSSADRDRILGIAFAAPHDSVCPKEHSCSPQRTLNLFGYEENDDQQPSAVARPSVFFDRVIRAYLSVYDGLSIDRLIADRERNSLFISKCWSLDVQASARELNWALLNARKANRIGPVPDISRFTMPASRMYQFLFASEIALRHIQDTEWINNQRKVSLDFILCDPTLSDRFESIAKQLAPGYSVFEYRWAAMSIRKNLRRSVKSRPPRFEDLGPTSQLLASKLPSQMGFYWFQAGHKAIYVGHAENIREQVDRIIQQGGSQTVFPEWMLDGITKPVHLAVASTNITAMSKRESLKNEICLTHSPLFNARSIQGRSTPNGISSTRQCCA